MDEKQNSAGTDGAGNDFSAHLDPMDDKEREALLALPYAKAMKAIEAEEPGAVALATGYILHYSEKVGERLQQGRDYLDLLRPGPDTPAIERIAMELVLASVEDELDSEDA